jgi:hypothetical protein
MALTPQSSFRDFMNEWCRQVTFLPPDEKQKRAYYWEHQQKNWFPALQWLTKRPNPFETNAWLWVDPTPSSQEEASVDDWVWKELLDPTHSPWKKFSSVCPVVNQDPFFQLVEPEPALEVADDEKNVAPDDFTCVICSGEVKYSWLYNCMMNDFTRSGLSRAEYQQKNYNVAQYTLDMTRLAHVPVNDDSSSDCRSFLETKEEHKGPIIRCTCDHLIHGQCALQWGNSSPPPESKSMISFVKLPTLPGPCVEFGLPRMLMPFKCPQCRATVSTFSVQVSSIPVNPTFPLIPAEYQTSILIDPETGEWGPYRLRRGALVWIFNLERYLGGEYGGGLGILKGYSSDSRNGICGGGGCFEILFLTPYPGDKLWIPVACVFDFSFFMRSSLPTRRQVDFALSRIEGNREAIQLYRPFLVQEPLQFWSVVRHPENPLWQGGGVLAPFQKVYQQLDVFFKNPRLRDHLQALISAHVSDTQSILVQSLPGAREFDLDDTILRLSRCTGYCQPSVDLMPIYNSIPNTGTLLQQLFPLRAEWNINLVMMVVFVVYVMGGYDIMPELNPNIKKDVWRLVPGLPDMNTVMPYPTFDCARIVVSFPNESSSSSSSSMANITGRRRPR